MNAKEHTLIYCGLYFHSTAGVLTIFLTQPFSLQRSHGSFPLSFTSVISCWACDLSDKTVRTALFSGCISRHVSHNVYGNVFRSLFLLPASQMKDAHSPYLPILVHKKKGGQRANCQWECDGQSGVNNLAHPSGFCCSSKHEQNTMLWFPPSNWPAWQTTSIGSTVLSGRERQPERCLFIEAEAQQKLMYTVDATQGKPAATAIVKY